MADYYPLIARAVTGLEKNTGEARRALYERARTALVAQLRGVVPALGESDITRERLALEEAIRKVEAEAARRSRLDAPSPDPAPRPAPPRPSQAEPTPPAPDTSQAEQKEESQPQPEQVSPPERFVAQPPPPEPPTPQQPPRIEPAMPSRPGANAPAERPSMFDQALQGFRDSAAASPDQPASRPSETQRVEPQFPMQGFGQTRREVPAPKPPRSRRDAPEPPTAPFPPRARRLEPSDEPPDEGSQRPGKRAVARKIALLALLVILGVAGAFAYRNSDKIVTYYQSTRGPATQTAKDTTQERAKISDRIGPGGQQDSTATPNAAAAPVAQRVVLYEQQPNTTERKQYIGSVIWRAENGSSGPGSAPDLALKADVEIPERQLRMTWTMRRNTDAALPASHTIEIIFNPAPGFPPGGIADMANVLMEQADHTSGVPLNGIRVKAAPGFFLVGLSAVPSDVQRNVQLLKDRPWVDIAIIYNDGNRALLALEKGVPGDRVFADVFRAWGQ